MITATDTSPAIPFAWRWGLPLFALCGMTLLLISAGNIPLFLWLNQTAALLGDTFWSHVTILGDTTLGLLLMLVLGARKSALAWQFVLAAILASVLSHGGKALFDALRPPAVLEAGSFHLIGEALQYHSFPSGHTTTAFVLAGILCLQVLHGWIRYAVLLMALLVGLSRIACGVHWPMDVLGGMLTGWISVIGGMRLAQFWPDSGNNRWLHRMLGVLGIVLALWVIAVYDNAYAGTYWMQVLLTLACLAWLIPAQLKFWQRGQE